MHAYIQAGIYTYNEKYTNTYIHTYTHTYTQYRLGRHNKHTYARTYRHHMQKATSKNIHQLHTYLHTY